MSMTLKGEEKFRACTLKNLCIVTSVYSFVHNQRRAVECCKDSTEEHKLLAEEKNWILF